MCVAMLFTNNLNYFLSLQLYFVGSLLTGCVNRLILESRVPLKSISTYSITSLLVVIFRLQIPFHHFISFLTLAPINFRHLINNFQSITRFSPSRFPSFFQAKGQREVTNSSTISGIYELLDLFFFFFFFFF